MNLLRPPPLALYVHLPWCVRKCPYCDFNSHAREGVLPEERYVSALLRDLERQAEAAHGREVGSVFFGGGTPSLFTPQAIARILEGARRVLRVAADAEVTLEANPGTIEHGRFVDYRSAGVTRVSVGGQSFNPQHLTVLGRIHSAGDIHRAVEELAAAGLDNFNIDLMYGLPGQSVAQAQADIDAAVALGPTHISHYQLTLEPGTAFFHKPPALPDEDACWEMQRGCQASLDAAGFRQYEISGYARAGRRCVHNLNYWLFGDYLGIGAGAHGKITDASRGAIERTAVVRQPRLYMEAMAADAAPGAGLDRQPVAEADLPFEFMLNALRLIEGFAADHFESRTGLRMEHIEPLLLRAQSRGLLERGPEDGWRPSELGLRFLNDLQAGFLAPRGEAQVPQQANPR